jgi:hypothetical protein
MLAFCQSDPIYGGDFRDVAFKIADRQEELRCAFRLVYQAYVAAGLSQPNPQRMRITPWHLLPTTEVLVATLRDEVIGTVSLVADGEMGIPMESIFPDHVAARRSEGVRFGEVSCLADRRRHFARTMPLVIRLMSLLGQTARARGIDTLLIVVHPRHVRFYERFIGFRALGRHQTYAAVCGKPAVALELDLAHLQENHAEAYQRFFGRPFPSDQLGPRSMTATIRSLFNEAAQAGAA